MHVCTRTCACVSVRAVVWNTYNHLVCSYACLHGSGGRYLGLRSPLGVVLELRQGFALCAAVDVDAMSLFGVGRGGDIH